MKKEYVYIAIILLLAAGAAGAGYQFFLKERLAEYRERENHMRQVEQKLTTMYQTFQGYNPDQVVEAYQREIQPWAAAVAQRTGYFRLSDEYQIEPIPDDREPRFYYEDRYAEMVEELRMAAFTRNPPVMLADLTFGVPSDMTGQNISKEMVEMLLRRLQRGIVLTRLLFENNAVSITQVELWPKRTEHDVLEMHTAGLEFTMRLGDLVNFLDALRREDRYFNVNGIRIENTNLMYPDPVLQVQMLLTEAAYKAEETAADEPDTDTAAPAADTGTPGSLFGGN